MKTSNKILLGLLVVVLSVPLMMAATLGGKMKDGKYTVEKFKYFRDVQVTKGSIAPFKAVKVISPKAQYLRCQLHASNEMNFNYSKEAGMDSVLVYNSNDTLFIQYTSLSNENENKNYRNWNNPIVVNLNIPAINTLIVDGAVVIIDSFPTSPAINVSIKNKGEIKDGSKKNIGTEEHEDAGISKVRQVKKEKDLHVVEIKKAEPVKKIEVIQDVKKEIQLDVKELLLYEKINRI